MCVKLFVVLLSTVKLHVVLLSNKIIIMYSFTFCAGKKKKRILLSSLNVKRSVVLFCKAERCGLVRRDVHKEFIILVIVTVVRTELQGC